MKGRHPSERPGSGDTLRHVTISGWLDRRMGNVLTLCGILNPPYPRKTPMRSCTECARRAARPLKQWNLGFRSGPEASVGGLDK